MLKAIADGPQMGALAGVRSGNEVLKKLQEEEQRDANGAASIDSHPAGTGTSSNGAFMFAEAS